MSGFLVPLAEVGQRRARGYKAATDAQLSPMAAVPRSGQWQRRIREWLRYDCIQTLRDIFGLVPDDTMVVRLRNLG